MPPFKLTAKKITWVSTSLVFTVSAWLIYANMAPYYCAAMPRAYWLSPLEVERRLKELGLRVAQIKVIEDRCYAVVARDAQGNFVDLVMHPATSDILYRSDPIK